MAEVSRFERWWLRAWPHRMHIRRFAPKFLKSSPDPFRGEVLEVGSGDGWTSQRILETFPQVELTATDSDPKYRKSFEKLGGKYGRRLHFEQADILNLPFDRSAFDLVVAIHVMHHISDLRGAVRQFLRVLRPGGLIGISDENPAYFSGPLKVLFPATSRIGLAIIVEVLEDEGCKVLVKNSGIHYYVWARKPYPVEVEKTEI